MFEKQLAFLCLRKMFKAANNSDMIYRMLSGTVVPQFIELLPQIKIENCDPKTVQEFCSCLELCLRTFKGPCGSRRKIIEEFIANQSSSSNFILLAKSFALLAFTGSNKQLQTNNSFNQFMIVSIFSLDTLIDSNFNEIHQLPYYSSVKDSPFLSLNTNLNRSERTLDFLNKFKFLSSVIQHLLDENFDGLVKIPIGLILNLLQRIVAFKANKKGVTANLESILNSNIIPAMYSNALLMLNQLITTCSTNLSVNSKKINNIFTELLDTFGETDKNHLIEVKSLWYKVISNWFNRLGNHLTTLVSKQWEELLINNFLEDIQLKKTSLEIHNTKQLKDERLSNTKFTDNHHFDKKRLELCSNACQLMDSFLINFSRQINVKKFQLFIYQLVTIVQDLYRIDLWRKSTYFTDQNLRLSLLKVLRNCLISFTNTSLLNNAITILNTILKLDRSSEIQLFAKETLIILNFPKTKLYLSSHEIQLDRTIVDQSVNLDSVNNQINETASQDRIVEIDNKLDANAKSKDSQNEMDASDAIETNDNLINGPTDNLASKKVVTFDLNTKELSSQSESDNSNALITNDNSQSLKDRDFTEQTDKINQENCDRKSVDSSSESESDNANEELAVLKNKEIINVDHENENQSNECNNKATTDLTEQNDENGNNKSPVKRVTRSRSRSKADEPTVTRLTRSTLKKKIEENDQNNQPDAKKVKTLESEEDNQQELTKATDDDDDVDDILKLFVES